MYIWRYICIYDGIYVYMTEYMYIWRYICIYDGIYVQYIWRYICIYDGIYVYMTVYMRVCMYIWRYICRIILKLPLPITQAHSAQAPRYFGFYSSFTCSHEHEQQSKNFQESTLCGIAFYLMKKVFCRESVHFMQSSR